VIQAGRRTAAGGSGSLVVLAAFAVALAATFLMPARPAHYDPAA
jgi:hypothetical protein